ncbi:hypothetical protein ACMG4H_14120 [Corynebacterium glutamicum]|uniref:hypothetical protein n=1 Tax=Corynebacterium glutamicum TaxID=1718 RepID=UPI003C79B536
MSVREDLPPLIANDGELAVVYQTAACTWGSYSASYPDGIEPEEFEAGRSLGYVGDLDEPAVDKGSRTWIRADVSVDASFRDAPRDLDGQGLTFHPDNPFVLVEEGSTEMFFVGTSTIPQVFDSAQTRTSGEIFVESIIGPEGMGHLVPGVDYVEGDIVPVLMGSSKIVDLPVAEVSFVSRLGEPVRYETKVGSALTGDAVALAQWNSELHALVAQETAKIQEELRKQEAQQTTDRQQTSLISIALGEVRETANNLKTVTEKQSTNLDVTYETLLGLRNWATELREWALGNQTNAQFASTMAERRQYFVNMLNAWEA